MQPIATFRLNHAGPKRHNTAVRSDLTQRQRRALSAELTPMKRIFLTLTIVSTLLLIGAFVLGLEIGDPRSVSAPTRRLMSYHLLTSVAALILPRSCMPSC